jgi:hypothetical protein
VEDGVLHKHATCTKPRTADERTFMRWKITNEELKKMIQVLFVFAFSKEKGLFDLPIENILIGFIRMHTMGVFHVSQTSF